MMTPKQALDILYTKLVTKMGLTPQDCALVVAAFQVLDAATTPPAAPKETKE